VSPIVDSHCHLDSKEFDPDRDEVIRRAVDAGVRRIVAVGTGEGPPDLEAAIRLAERHPEFYATVGIHPHDAAKANDSDLARLPELLRHPRVVALGEIGLDYHYDFSPRDRQQAVFREQLSIAKEAGKPVVIHTREAWDDTFALLEQYWAPHGIGGIMHCFSGSPGEARRSLDLGFHLSFGGIATFPKAADIRQAAIDTPADRILVETDAPYLAPVPKRGKRNEPAFVVHTAAKIAELRGVTLDDFALQTTANFERLCLRGASIS
jgi:TatD DNase family protein